MISHEGIEDTCGVLWQWSRDQGGVLTSAAWANAYDGNDTGVGGQHYQAPYRGLLGGFWSDGVACGSRGSRWLDSPLNLASHFSSRSVAEPASSRF
jgi:formylglycine-generating enzyme required for sulfatase activity